MNINPKQNKSGVNYYQPLCAKRNHIICPRTGKYTGGIIIGITISVRACGLELLGIVCRLAHNRVSIKPSAAVLVGVEHVAGAPATDRLPINLYRQLGRATGPKVTIATRHTAVSMTVYRCDNNGQVEAINKTNIVKIYSCECKFRKSGRGLSRGATLEGVAAGCGLAWSGAIFVEVAASPAPYPARPPHRCIEDHGLSWFQSKASTMEVLPRGYSWPDYLSTVVYYGENSS